MVKLRTGYQSLKASDVLPLRFSRCVLAMLSALMFCLASAQSRADIVLNDAIGRQVRLAAPAERIVISDSLILLSLALIDPDPVARLAGWAGPRRLDQGMFDAFRLRFPQIEAIPIVAATIPANAAVESILSVKPDLFVIGVWQPGWESAVSQLEAAGVPVLFLDRADDLQRDPTEAVISSIALLGAAIGQSERAGEFSGFVRTHYQRILERLKNVDTRPKVLVDAFAGAECCSTPGRHNRLTQFLERAGGANIGSALVAGYEGRLSAEYVLTSEPDVYIATGVPRPPVQGGLVLGGALTAEASRGSLRNILSGGVRRELKAVREGRAYGVSHQLPISALSILAFECFAKWIHPDLFADLDPARTLDEINRRFMPVRLDGTFWIELDAAPAGARQ